MARIFYVNYKHSTEPIARRLRKEGHEVECLDNDNFKQKRKMPGHGIVDLVFYYDYSDDLSNYDTLIAHLGVTFGKYIEGTLEKFPRLKIAIVSSISEDYTFVYDELGPSKRGRFLVCGYDSPELISFVKGER